MISATSASKLLPYAKGKINDSLFAIADDLSYLGSQPSSEMVLNRWGKIPAESAVHIASILEDSTLIDNILQKEKRITVLRSLALNKKVSYPSRIYLLQYGLILGDHELKSNAVKGFTPNELLAILHEDQRLQYVTNGNTVLEAVSQADDEDLKLKFLAANNGEYLYKLTYINLKDALYFGEKIGFAWDDPNGERINRYYARPNPDATVEDLKAFLKVSKGKNTINFLHLITEGDLDIAYKVSEELFEYSLKNKNEFTLNDFKLLEKINYLEAISKFRLNPADESSADLYIEKMGAKNSIKVILEHPNNLSTLKYIKENFDQILIGLTESDMASKFFMYFNRNLFEFGFERAVKLYQSFPEKDYSQRLLDHMCKTGKSTEYILENLPSELLGRISEIPTEFNLELLLDRVIKEFSGSLKVKLLLAIIDSANRTYRRDYDADKVTLRAITGLYDEGAFNEIIELIQRDRLEEQSLDLAINFAKNNSSMQVMLGNLGKNMRNTQVIVKLIDIVEPKQGWGEMLRYDSVAEKVYKYLESELQSNLSWWETAFTLLDDWQETLPKLVATAKTL